jgi:hypothetical protein
VSVKIYKGQSSIAAMLLAKQEEGAYDPYVLETKASPVVDLGVLGQDFTGSRMGHDIWRHLLEDIIRHGMTEESTKIDLIEAYFLSNLTKSGSLVDWEGFR